LKYLVLYYIKHIQNKKILALRQFQLPILPPILYNFAMEKPINIILAGVGGQGIILAGNIIARTALESGFDVKANELHGMAQRGGSVLSHIRFGKIVHSPLIPEGEADILVSLEELESMRYERFLKPGGIVIMNTRKIVPSSISAETYPSDIKSGLEKSGFKVEAVDALAAARNAGSVKIENIILLGLLAKHLPFKQETWEKVIRSSVPEKYLEMNLKAFGIL